MKACTSLNHSCTQKRIQFFRWKKTGVEKAGETVPSKNKVGNVFSKIIPSYRVVRPINQSNSPPPHTPVDSETWGPGRREGALNKIDWRTPPLPPFRSPERSRTRQVGGKPFLLWYRYIKHRNVFPPTCLSSSPDPGRPAKTRSCRPINQSNSPQKSEILEVSFNHTWKGYAPTTGYIPLYLHCPTPGSDPVPFTSVGRTQELPVLTASRFDFGTFWTLGKGVLTTPLPRTINDAFNSYC